MKKMIVTFLLIAIFLFFGCTANNEETNQPNFLIGEEVLEVIVMGPDNLPLKNLEVDLWTKEKLSGPPNAGYTITDEQGKAIFNVPIGEYKIGFNTLNFPQNLENPVAIYVVVTEGVINSKIINLETIDSKDNTINNSPDGNVSCSESWTCGAWAPCTNETQTRVCTETNNCGTETNKPITSQNCTGNCVEDWTCGAWTTCTNGTQTRICTDKSNCQTTLQKPLEQQEC